MKQGVRSQVFLLTAIVLGVYYSALSAGINSVDDTHIIASYGMGAGKGLAEIFKPATAYYYRPLVEFSFYLDNLLWGMHPRFMHLENIIFHVLNTVLVFLLAGQMARAWSVKTPWFPFACALLFAVHPINTESVTWIAGRTDPLAGVFIFAAFWCLFQCSISEKLFYLWPSLLLFMLAVLTKEIAVCFLPAAALLTAFWPGEVRLRSTALRVLAGIFFCGILLVFALFIQNFSAAAFLNSNTGGVSTTLQNVSAALGFYLKKLILPLPLNFAIDAVPPLYSIPGVAVLLSLPLWLKRQWFPTVLGAVCCIFLLPALLVSVTQVTWTPIAERYLYLPSAFFCTGLVGGVSLLLEKIQRPNWLLPLTSCLAISAALITVQRNLVWHDNLTFFRDTVTKSPNYGAVRLELGVALAQNGMLKEARAELEMAESLNKRPSIRNRIKANLMAVRLRQGDYQGAREYFWSNFRHKDEADPDLLHILNKAYEGLARETADGGVRHCIYNEMIDTYGVLYRKTKDPFNLYQCGVWSFRMGDNVQAVTYMRKAVKEAPVNTHYTAAAKKWLQNLEAKQ